VSAGERGGVLGRIDCPCCGYKEGMRITRDKNGHPFGFCDANCRVQMRIGPDPDRVAAFIRRFPWAFGGLTEPSKPTTPPPAPAPAPAPAAKKPPAPAPAPATPRRSSMEQALDFLGIK
jgi:hypothetical protein